MPPAQASPKDNVVHGVFQAFERREDDFSIALQLAGDPMFWLRLDKESGQGKAVFTDFIIGAQSDQVMVRALNTLLSEKGGIADLDLIVFLDLVPGDHEPTQYRLELNRISRSIRGWIDAVARINGLSVDSFNLDSQREKARVTVQLA